MLVTTSRADYGILFPLLKALKKDPQFKASLIATGSHLSSLHGKTVNEIKKDKISISETVPMTPRGDRASHICEAVARGVRGFSKVFQKKSPDLLLVAGDRYELLSACTAALLHRIPIAHLHGGELTRGAVDDPIRHAVTKMASLHFPSTELYAQRIVQMGEEPSRVHVVGALGIDAIKLIPRMDRGELTEFSGVDFTKDVALMTYHPVTLDDYHLAAKQVQEILNALTETELSVLVTMPNADTGSLKLYEAIRRHVQNDPKKFTLVKNLGKTAYLSAMHYARVMIGNSSSGIVESASFKLPVVNVGDRQAGRLKPANVIDCDCSKEAILGALRRALSEEFIRSLSELKNPYGDGHATERCLRVLRAVDLSDKTKLLKKSFYDLETGKLENFLSEVCAR